ncbi:ubiquinone biosynthesis protein UbiB [Syntrophotalea acetylenivorans]|uniref:Ubiquinone biosynthesis protein UbiB n=1 Tax=Syntrophotalea acetylenivorans TaxID=1842532 RepID=A0A1L3GNY6_9BACT|nr:AarF/UbiB family protein [Syntrophotalea acetylenivorans]APG27610.1 ubiquinone biosynthesis protein UbiB [Syntrophotalea acetylenivorans]
MQIFSRINRNIRSLRRYRQVLGVLIKYGFGHVVEQLNIHHYLHRGKQLISRGAARKEIEHLTAPHRLRLALEELGPTFIKLGQLLSTRPDILSVEYTRELGKLQDKVPMVPAGSIREVIETEFGQSVETLYAEFSFSPLAAASIAQVHRGKLHSGEEVVIKVRRPDIARIIETDIDILQGLAYLVERHLASGTILNPVALVKEFRRTIEREMNFNRERHTIDRFRENFLQDATVYVPQTYPNYCGETVLTLEYVDGIKVSNFDQLREASYDLKTIACNGANAILQQVLVHGLFHGDPHPGNIFVLPNNVVCFIDFGMIGRLDRELTFRLAELLTAVLQRDVERLVAILLYSGDLTEEIRRPELKKAVSDFVDDYYEVPLQEIRAGRLLIEFVEILIQFRIPFSPDLMLLAKTLITMEGIGRQLDPEFNMVGHLKPFMSRLLQEKVGPTNLSREGMRMMQSYGALLKTLPDDLKEFITRINRNKFKIDLEHRGLERLITDLDKSSNRLSFSLLIAALIIGSSIVMQTDKGPLLFGFPALGILGYSIAAVLGLWLAIGILRSGRL